MTDSAAHLPNSAEQLSEVLLQLYEPHLKNVKVQLQELVYVCIYVSFLF